MKILIIGSKGFIGSSLKSYLKLREYEVKEADIVHEYGNENYIQLDPNASDYEFNQLFNGNTFDACINCSGAAEVSKSFQNPLHDYRLNTVNVYRILNSIKTYNPSCLFISLSSAAVYGNPEVLPIKESQKLNPLSPYGFHKLQSEQICEYFSRLHNLNTVGLRVFSAYGPGLKKQLFWDLYQKAKANPIKIELFGSGEEIRDFIFIEDICRVIENVIESKPTGWNVYNVASGNETKIKDVAKEFCNQMGYQGVLEFTQQTIPGYPSKWVADISSLHKLGINNFVNLEDGIFQYLKWIKSI